MNKFLNLIKSKYDAMSYKKEKRIALLIIIGLLIIITVVISINTYIDYNKCSQIEKDAIEIAVDRVNEDNISESSLRKELIWYEYDEKIVNLAVRYVKQEGWTEVQEAKDVLTSIAMYNMTNAGTDRVIREHWVIVKTLRSMGFTEGTIKKVTE